MCGSISPSALQYMYYEVYNPASLMDMLETLGREIKVSEDRIYLSTFTSEIRLGPIKFREV